MITAATTRPMQMAMELGAQVSLSSNDAAVGADRSVSPKFGSAGIRWRNASASIARADLIVFALILVMGAITFAFVRHATNFVQEDVFYADAGRSLLQHGFYGINGRTETNQPPGLPAILAGLFAIFGYGYTICLHAMVIFETLAFLVTYELLRRRLPGVVAAAICLVLMSSPIFFQMATQEILACYPVLFTTVTALLAFEEYEKAKRRLWRTVWAVTLAVMTVASILIVSGAIALLGGMLAVIVVTYFRDKKLARQRLKLVVPVVLLGVMLQIAWMSRKPDPLEWPTLPGYPRSYLQQLKVKNGNDPEMGMATLSDIPLRVWKNLDSQADLLVGMVARHGVRESKTFVVIIPVLIVGAGWARSLLDPSEALIAWYFAGYQFIYLLWPWEMEHRFFVPVAPLACMYLWKGLATLRTLVTTRRRLVGAALALLSFLLAISGWRWMFSHAGEGMGLYPDEVAAAIWTILSGCFLWVACTGNPLSSLPEGSRPAERWRQHRHRFQIRPARWIVAATVVLILIGIGPEVRIAEANVRYENLLRAGDTSVVPMWSEVESGQWIHDHTAPGSVVMARQLPIVCHYAERKMVWCAPISNPQVLMNGIVSHQVDYIVVINHPQVYYLPDDGDCFAPVLAKYAGAFRPVFQDARARIFQVDKRAARAEIGRTGASTTP